MLSSMSFPALPLAAAITGPRPVDLLAFLAMGLVWMILAGVVLAIVHILRGRARDPEAWGRGPGV